MLQMLNLTPLDLKEREDLSNYCVTEKTLVKAKVGETSKSNDLTIGKDLRKIPLEGNRGIKLELD